MGIAALVNHYISYDAVYSVVFGNSIRKSLEHKDNTALTTAITISNSPKISLLVQ